ncbi:hypothetical protein DRQ07_04185 [candidate division KSB1 bacterium]|nr:MAG: hypothetical protein DRQ07_04185 [candidate division KSB1 bacterium]
MQICLDLYTNSIIFTERKEENMKKFVLLLLTISVLILSCQKNSVPDLSQQQQELLNAYVKLFELREKYSLSDSAFIDSSEIILNKSGFTPEKFQNAVNEFKNNPEQWNIFFEKAMKKLNKTKASANSG